MPDSAANGSSRPTTSRYGWVVVATGFVILAITFGVQYSFGVFFKPIQETFGWSRATTSWVMTIHVVVFGLSQTLAGWTVDRIGTRSLYAGAAVLVGASLFLCSRVSEPWQLYLTYGLPLGIGLSCGGPVVMPVVTRWFSRNRGIALGIVSAGVGFGTMVMAPFCDSLITAYGWRTSLVILGIVSFVVLAGCAVLFRASPDRAVEPGAAEAGKSPNTRQAKGQAFPGMTLGQAMRTRGLYLIILAHSIGSFTLRVVTVHMAPHAIDTGISAAAAALAVGAIGGCSIVGRLVMGYAQDRIGPRSAMIICLAVQGLAMLALPFMGSELLYFVFAIAFGFFYGGDIPQVPALVAQGFGLSSMGVIYGFVLTFSNLGGALGPVAGGYAFDLTGSYTIVFLLAALILSAGVFCTSRLKIPD